ncbi:MAG: CinA family protein [Candidatus Azotimanducaceae bacterium]
MFENTTNKIGERLVERGHTVSIAESSTGGLISANLLSVAGASQFFLGGSVVYTLASRRVYLDLDREKLKGLKPLTEAMVLEFAASARAKLNATWGIAELGAAGPAGTPYGHGPGVSVIGVVGPKSASRTIETGSSNRIENMNAFTKAGLELLAEVLGVSIDR